MRLLTESMVCKWVRYIVLGKFYPWARMLDKENEETDWVVGEIQVSFISLSKTHMWVPKDVLIFLGMSVYKIDKKTLRPYIDKVLTQKTQVKKI